MQVCQVRATERALKGEAPQCLGAEGRKTCVQIALCHVWLSYLGCLPISEPLLPHLGVRENSAHLAVLQCSEEVNAKHHLQSSKRCI